MRRVTWTTQSATSMARSVVGNGATASGVTNAADAFAFPVTRFARLSVGALLPPPIGFFLFMVVVDPPTQVEMGDVLAFFLMLPLPYVVVGLQAIVYSLLMEFYVWRVFGVNVLGIFISGLLGALCGLSFFAGELRGELPNFVLAGLGAGLTTGFVLRYMRRIAARKRPLSPPAVDE